MSLKTAENIGVEERFRLLSNDWKAACAFTSSTSVMVAHPSYQAVIALGPRVVPLLLHALETEPVHWFEALKAITGEDPVSPEAWGNIPAMAAAWLAWGRSRNLI
jgi:hypothetical protein